MRPVNPDIETELLRALKDLQRAMARLTGFMVGALGCLAALEAWAWWRGSSPLLQALACAVGFLGLIAAGLWLSARRGVSRWTWAVDQRLGKGSGRALLELGSFQEGAFALEKGRQALALGEKPKRG
jgi:hypothetical protein